MNQRKVSGDEVEVEYQETKEVRGAIQCVEDKR